MAIAKHIIPGEKFHRLTVICEAARLQGNHNRRVTAKCECGKTKEYFISHLRNGKVKSCGCWRKDSPSLRAKHRHTEKYRKSKAYAAWMNMKERCSNKNRDSFHRYGGRGIRVCERWVSSFENFLLDMGEPPEGMTLDRYPDGDGDYQPDNCRWATRTEQANNRNINQFIEFNGRTMTVSQWSRELGIARRTLSQRINELRWPIEKAFTTPIRK